MQGEDKPAPAGEQPAEEVTKESEAASDEGDEESEGSDFDIPPMESEDQLDDLLATATEFWEDKEYDTAIAIYSDICAFFAKKYEGEDEEVQTMMAEHYFRIGEAYHFQSQQLGGEIDEEDEDSSFCLAWANLEAAKNQFYRIHTKYAEGATQKELDDAKLMEAECRCRLGQLSLERDDSSRAFADLDWSRKLRLEVYGKDQTNHRRLLESYYNLGLCAEMSNKMKDAEKWFTLAFLCLVKSTEGGQVEEGLDMKEEKELKLKLANKVRDVQEELKEKQYSQEELQKIIREAMGLDTKKAEGDGPQTHTLEQGGDQNSCDLTSIYNQLAPRPKTGEGADPGPAAGTAEPSSTEAAKPVTLLTVKSSRKRTRPPRNPDPAAAAESGEPALKRQTTA